MTDFDTKCLILRQFCADYAPLDPDMDDTSAPDDFSRGMYPEWFEMHDLLPTMLLCHAARWTTFTDIGVEVVEKSWTEMCEAVGADPRGDYTSVDDLVDLGK